MTDPKDKQAEFDFAAAIGARDEGIDNSEIGAGYDWMHNALIAVRRVAQAHSEFTTDDLWVHVDPPREPRAMGACMQAARKMGLCEPTDRTLCSHRVRCHARPLRIWRSLICGTTGRPIPGTPPKPARQPKAAKPKVEKPQPPKAEVDPEFDMDL
jgi:hypothetical protein